MDSHVPNISFDGDGKCNYCGLHDRWMRQSNPDSTLLKLVECVKASRIGRYDCVVGVSGGCDSSYLLCLAKNWGLHPLAVHWNNGWNTKVAEQNIKRMVDGLGVDFYEVGMNRQEYDDVCRSFLLASVPDADIPNDIALATVLYYAAERFNVKYILNGHSFQTEGTTPLGWSYMDAKYVETVQESFGTVPLHTFPNLWLRQWLRWILVDRIKRVRPLWLIDYVKEDAKRFLNSNFGWRWYGGHHLENKYTKFVTNYLQPRKFGVDLRYVEYSALVRSGQMSREEALERIKLLPQIDREILMEVKQRLGLSDEDFKRVMQAPIKAHEDYGTYHSLFRRWRWFFWLASKLNLVPETFYVKYTK